MRLYTVAGRLHIIKKNAGKNVKKLHTRESEMLNNIDILIIEDDANICANLNDILSEDGYKIASTGTISLAKKKINK